MTIIPLQKKIKIRMKQIDRNTNKTPKNYNINQMVLK